MNAHTDKIQNTTLNFGKFKGKTIKQICKEGNYEYLNYVSNLDFNSFNKDVNLCLERIKMFVACREESLKPSRSILNEQLKTLLKPVITCLQFSQISRALTGRNNSLFLQSIREQLESGVLPFSEKVRAIVIDQAAKTKGRRNSKTYKVAYNEYSEIIERANVIHKNFLKATEYLD
jgi:hypothetical protein